MVPAEVGEGKLVAVEGTVLGHFPEGDGCDGIVADVEFPTSAYLLTHFDHALFLDGADLALPADPDDDVPCLSEGAVEVLLEGVVEVPEDVPPVAEGVAPHLADIELLVVVLPLEAGGQDGVVGDVLHRVEVLVLLPPRLLLPLQLLLLLQHLQQSEAHTLRQVAQVLTQSQQKTPISYHLLRPLEARVELALPPYGGASVVEAPVVEGGVAIGLSALPFELYDIVLVVDGVRVDVGALGRGAVDGAVLRLEGALVATWTN